MTETTPAPLFSTERLDCRRWRSQDLEAIHALYGNPRVVRWVGDGSPASREGCEEWLRVTERNYQRRGYGMWALTPRGGGPLIGCCGLVHPGGQPEPEVKYALAEDHWGQGLASELLQALLPFGAQSWQLSRILATVAPENLASQRVLEKAGARRLSLRDNDDGSQTVVFEWQPEG